MIVAKSVDVESRAIKTVEGLPVQGEVTMRPLLAGDQMLMLEIHYPPGAGSPLHTHQHESLCYVVKGKVEVAVGSETYTLEAGDACRHPQGVAHSIEAVDETTVVEVKSPAQPLERFLATAGRD